MSISSDQNRRNYSGNGSSATFNYPYEFHNDSDLAVLIYNSSRATVTVAQALTTNYNLSGTKDLQGRYLNGADVVFNSSPATGDEIVIFGSTAVNSVYALGFNEHISRPDLVKALDHLVLINQRLNNQVTRSMGLRDSYPYTFDTRLPEKLPAGAPIVVNSGGVGFTISLVTNSSGFTGVFPMIHGGLGAALTASKGQLLYADQTTSMALFGPGGQDEVVIAQSSLVPKFGAVNLASGSSVINVSPASRGGTAHSSFVGASMVYASSTSVLSFIANGGTGQPLVGNNGGAPSYQAIDLASGSSVSNILATSRGGTGNSGYVQYGVAYFETATKIAHIPSAANGRVLTANGSSAPTFEALPPDIPVAPLRKTSDYVMAVADETVLCDGSSASFTVRPPSAASSSGEHYYVKKIDASTNTIIISGSAAIDGTSIVLREQFDAVRIESDGTEFHVISRHHHGRVTPWVQYTPDFVAFGSSTLVSMFWRRNWANLEVAGRWTNGVVVASEARVPFPSGLTAQGSSAFGASTIRLAGLLTNTDPVVDNLTVLVEPSVSYFTLSRQSTGTGGVIKSDGNIFNSSSVMSINASAPIAGWEQ